MPLQSKLVFWYGRNSNLTSYTVINYSPTSRIAGYTQHWPLFVCAIRNPPTRVGLH